MNGVYVLILTIIAASVMVLVVLKFYVDLQIKKGQKRLASSDRPGAKADNG